jgi:hypothetical protein
MSKPPGGEKDTKEAAGRASTLAFSTVKGSLQESSADFMQYVRTTLQQAQEITDVVGNAERVAAAADAKKESGEGGDIVSPTPVAQDLERQIEYSVMWVQQLLEFVSFAESRDGFDHGKSLREGLNLPVANPAEASHAVQHSGARYQDKKEDEVETESRPLYESVLRSAAIQEVQRQRAEILAGEAFPSARPSPRHSVVAGMMPRGKHSSVLSTDPRSEYMGAGRPSTDGRIEYNRQKHSGSMLSTDGKSTGLVLPRLPSPAGSQK